MSAQAQVIHVNPASSDPDLTLSSGPDLTPSSGPDLHIEAANGEVSIVVDVQPSAQELELQELLDTRPSLQHGRGSYHGPNRSDVQYRSLPHRSSWVPPASSTQEPTHGRGVRRSSSLPGMSHVSSTAALIETEMEGALQPEPWQVKQTSRRLRERIIAHRKTIRYVPKAATHSAWSNFKDIKWPKFKSRFAVLLSWELWKGHMKEVEGHFGTAIVSYFIFLRFLFFMNLIIFAFWFGFVVVPQSVFEDSRNPPGPNSTVACVGNISETSVCPTAGSDLEVFLVPSDCREVVSSSYEVRRCEFSDGVASRESSSGPVTVSENSTELFDCLIGNSVDVEVLSTCVGVDPFIPWYQYIVDFVLGQGVLNETLLFHGRYSNVDVGVYNLPVAFLLLAGFVYAVSILLLVYKMGHAYNESYVEFKFNKQSNFCNKLFTAWDFNITDPNTAKVKRAHIRTHFEEELADHERRNASRSPKQLLIVVLIRTLTNLFTVLVLVGAGAIIFYTAQFQLDTQLAGSESLLRGLVLPVVITVLNAILPFLFSFLARFERFKTLSGEIRMTILRAILVRLSSLIVLIITLYILIQCTQEEEDPEPSDEDSCSFSPINNIDNFFSRPNETTGNCPMCWETFFGQEFYKLGLTNFVVSALSTLVVETTRNVVSRLKWKGIGEKIGKGQFNIPKSILDLIYTQSLLWLGFIFSPMLPVVILITSFMLFYVKKYSLLWNLVPSKRGTFRSAKTNFLFLLLMLGALFLFLVPIGFAVAR